MIHSAAGRCLLEECLSLGGCEVGEAKMTSGYHLPAKHVIHTVGPEGKDEDRGQLLRSVGVAQTVDLSEKSSNPQLTIHPSAYRSCYESTLALCLKHGLRTVAFSCISTGAYHYPSVEAADIALGTTRAWLLTNHDTVDRIVFVTRRPRDEEAYGFLMLTYFPLSITC